jgi:hypothetical protein
MICCDKLNQAIEKDHSRCLQSLYENGNQINSTHILVAVAENAIKCVEYYLEKNMEFPYFESHPVFYYSLILNQQEQVATFLLTRKVPVHPILPQRALEAGKLQHLQIFHELYQLPLPVLQDYSHFDLPCVLYLFDKLYSDKQMFIDQNMPICNSTQFVEAVDLETKYWRDALFPLTLRFVDRLDAIVRKKKDQIVTIHSILYNELYAKPERPICSIDIIEHEIYPFI